MRELFISFHKRKSFFHRLDPISKLIWAFCMMCLSLVFSNFLYQLVLCFIVFFFARILTRVPFSEFVVFVWIYIGSSFIFFCTLLLVSKGEHTLFSIASIPITREALDHAANVGVRMLVFMGIAIAFIDSTDPHDLGLILTQKLKINYTFTFMLFVSLRFLPIFEKELSDLRQAYQLRYYKKKSHIRDIIGKLTFMTTSLLHRGMRRSMILALSMESRAFRAYNERCYLTTVEITKKGKYFSIAVVLITLSSILLL